jgi:hypothetical protein
MAIGQSMQRESSVQKMRIFAFAVLVGAVAAAAAIADPGGQTGPSSSQSPYVLRSEPGVVAKSILTVGDSVNLKPDGTPYRLVGIPDGLGAFDNGDGTFTLLMNHELGSTAGIVRAHGARGSFVSKWTIQKGSLRVLHGEDQIQRLFVWNGATWVQATGDGGTTRLNRLCSADLPPVSAFYNAATGNGYSGRLFMNGEEGGTQGRPFGHVFSSGQSYELTPWLGNMSFENVVAHPDTGSDAAVGQQVYLYRGTKQSAGNPVEQAGLSGGQLYGLKVLGVPQSEYQKANWHVGDEFDFQLADVSAHAGNAALLEADSQAGGVTNFQRPEDGAWDPRNPSDFYFVTTSSFGPLPAENRTGETRLWRLRFDDPADPSQGGVLKLLVSGPVGTSGDANSPGPQMLDNITIDGGKVLLQEDVGNQPYLGHVWSYGISSGDLSEIAVHDPARFTPGAPGFLTQDEEASGIIPAPFLGDGKYLLDVQAHYNITGELVQGGQLLQLHVPPGRFN